MYVCLLTVMYHNYKSILIIFKIVTSAITLFEKDLVNKC